MALEQAQSAGILIPFQAYVTGALSGEAFNSDSYTVYLCIPAQIWEVTLSPFFPILANVPINQFKTVNDKDKAPFRMGIGEFDETNVELTVKVHSSVFKAAFPEGKVEEPTPVQVIISFFVYGKSAKIDTPGLSLRVGYMTRA